MGIVLPKYDFVFRALMGNEKVRRHFISDMLGIPLEQIKSLRVSNPFLWKRRNKHKLGILDVLLVLNDDRKINIELQVRVVKYWDKKGGLLHLQNVHGGSAGGPGLHEAEEVRRHQYPGLQCG